MSYWKDIGKAFLGRKQNTFSSAASTGMPNATWTNRNYENFAKEAYIKNFVSFRCIDIISQSVGSVPWDVYNREKGKRKTVVDEHPIKRILRRANPTTSFSMFNYAVLAFLGLAGDSYIEKIGPITGPNAGVPRELQYYRPDHIKFILDEDTKELQGFKQEVNGKVLKTWMIDPITQQCDLLHIKTFHPLHQIEGLSKVEPAAQSIDTSNEAIKWNKSLLQNQARPGMILSFDGALGSQQFERLEKQLNAKFSGGSNAGKNLIVEGDMKDAKPFGFSPSEMDFLKGNETLTSQICATWGVPTQFFGLGSTYANFKEAQKFFWENTVFWHMEMLKGEYNNWIFPENDKIFIDYDFDQVPALEFQRKERWEKIKQADFLTVNEKREAAGYEKKGPECDVILVASTQIPIDIVGVTEDEVDKTENAVEEDDDMDEEAKKRLLSH